MFDTLNVELVGRSYPIYFAPSLIGEVVQQVTQLREAGRKVAFVTDERVATAQTDALLAMAGDAPIYRVGAGEGAKSLPVLGGVWDFLAAQRVDRGGVVFAFGGGVVGDLTGFAAASYLRGVAFYQIPTTLLAMVDSSVGGKTGINLTAGKNLVGAFHQPEAVYIATELLQTLPPREFAAGMAEVIKTALLGDPSLWQRLEKSKVSLTSEDLAEVIKQCCALKARVVAADERETAKEGGRALLNLGHTFGHAIEAVTGYGTYLHGEAVAIGLVAAARLSHRLGLIDAPSVIRVEGVVTGHCLPTRLREPLPVEALLDAMSRDKKVRAGNLRFVVLKSLGEAVTRDDIAPSLARNVWLELGASKEA